jgi:hypothetical protein
MFDVALDRGEGNCAYALGTWDGVRRIGFRWNGSDQSGPIGNPQSRGLPTWTILDPALHEGVVAMLPQEKQVLAKRFLNLRSPAEWQTILKDANIYHEQQAAKIASAAPPVAFLHDRCLVMHVIPFGAVDTRTPRFSDELFKNPDRFPPMDTNRPSDSKIDVDGLLTGSHASGLREPQRSHVRVSRAGIVEAVLSLRGKGHEHEFLELPHIQALVIKYARIYSAAVNSGGIEPPVAILVSLVGMKGVRLLQDFIGSSLPEDLPFGALGDQSVHFAGAYFETVPADYNESARSLSPLLNHMANAAGLATSPLFDANGNYTAASAL